MEPAHVTFLMSLPKDGRPRELLKEELSTAQELAELKQCHMTTGLWPCMQASITFEGRKTLSRL